MDPTTCDPYAVYSNAMFDEKTLASERKKPSSASSAGHPVSLLFLRAGSGRSLALQATPRCKRIRDGGACLGLTSE